MASIKGTQTERNLLASFAGESQARNRYTFFASVARKEGYEQIAAIFQETADNEKEITAEYPAGVIGDTLANLRAAAAGEKLEWTTLYPDFEAVAREEGFPQIAASFHEIAEVEEYHERRYKILTGRVATDQVFKRAEPIKWKCRNCGYIHEGTEAPSVCPACQHPRAYYEPWAENY